MKDDSLAREWTGRVAPGSPLTDSEWKVALHTLKVYAEAMSVTINDLARRISGDAGLDPQLLGLHPHNALVGYNAGQPWPNVDYNRVLAVKDLLDAQFIANRAVDAFDKATRLDPHTRWLEANKD